MTRGFTASGVSTGQGPRFKCPQCGSMNWGTQDATRADMENATGHCHGDGCRFTWRRGDDRLYFTHRESEPEPLRVVAAAVREADGTVNTLPPPARHHTILHQMAEAGRPTMQEGQIQGFILSDGRFCMRTAAKRIAREAGQLLPRASNLTELFSEDVW